MRREAPTSSTDGDVEADLENLNKKQRTAEIEDPAAPESSAAPEFVPETALARSSPSPYQPPEIIDVAGKFKRLHDMTRAKDLESALTKVFQKAKGKTRNTRTGTIIEWAPIGKCQSLLNSKSHFLES